MKSTHELLKAGYAKFSAPAKLNLFLKILNKRKNGYHNLQSIFQLIDLQDEIFIKIRHEDTEINIKNSSLQIKPKDDLAFKAAQLMLLNQQLGADIIINKKIPIGAGLGGGSSNAATVMMAINKLCKFNFSNTKLIESSLKLGADIPFFINGKNAWVEGIGELLHDIKISNYIYIVMVPNLSINTKEIFSCFKLTKTTIPLKISSSFNAVDHDFVENDLEETVIKKYLKMAELLQWLSSFGNAKMSGTGSSIFVRAKNLKMAESIKKNKPRNANCFIVKGLSVHPFYSTDQLGSRQAG
ncbi:4-(cytidine 5'-diphospho)-2-C-methyl-D-erythritol kinase [Methylophilaceae bacterium]|jgi:4-diphosphocytidyl-2-C-methyl-D-erythritol kinase|nr:4-(cytidine 5'-diphospho)-2-C-methyl-D-erythritol kinase [Methylophilaceae bacterium]